MTLNAVIASRHKFTASDGLELSYCVWEQENVNDYHAMVLVLHGIGFHSEPYSILAQNIDVPNTVFAGLDFRGHGLSEGNKQQLPHLQVMIRDIEDWVNHMRSLYPNTRVFLLAESMAGPYGTLYAAQNPNLLDGLVLVAPAVIPSHHQVLHAGTLKDIAKILLRRSSADILLGGSRINAGVEDAEMISVRANDKMAIQAVKPRYMWRIGYAMFRLVMKLSVAVSAPVFIIHGDKDNILSPNGSKWLFSKLKSPDKRLKILPRAYHTILWDSWSQQTFKLIERWLLSLYDTHGLA